MALSPQRDHFGDIFLLGIVPHQRAVVVSSEPERDYFRRISGGLRLTLPAGLLPYLENKLARPSGERIRRH
jgi:hypothetical protein